MKANEISVMANGRKHLNICGVIINNVAMAIINESWPMAKCNQWRSYLVIVISAAA